MLDKTYTPGEIEARISAAWDAANAFAPSGRGEPFCVMIPPPNVTGSLHIGHALNNTLQDVIVRLRRMQGRDVLWQPGLDHAGIATQSLVERQLAAAGEPDRRAMGRDAFMERVWRWKAESGGTIVAQLRRLGASCDWSRERFTMAPGQMSEAVIKAFVDLHAKGLIYRDKRLVNWDCTLLTAISDLEVVNVETQGHYWHFRYPLEGVDFDPADPATFIVVATTRPETMLGDSAVAVHPEDARYAHLVGRNVVLPLVGRHIPIIADAYADPEKGSGAVKITPAHDFNDFEVGKRHGLEAINIMTADGRLRSLRGPAVSDAIPENLRGLDRFEARKAVVAMLEAGGFLEKVEPALIQVPTGDRSGTVIEPYLTDQWYVDAKALAGPAIAAVREGRTRFFPAQYANTYFDWMENIQPWCISRQLWWGHRIPAWYGTAKAPDAKGGKRHIFVAESAHAAIGQAEEYYGKTVRVFETVAGETGEEEVRRRIPGMLGAFEWIEQDEDVLDTWFSSALWPFSTLGWPDDTPELARYYPNQLLVTGFDIIFFWVARMMMMGTALTGRPPFPDIVIHALVRDERGQKMSKSKGNVVDPLDLIDRYGADALRFTMAAMATPGRDLRLAETRVEGYRNFATKLWNAARFAELNGCVADAAYDPAASREAVNRWALGRYAAAAAEVTASLDAYRFDDAAAALYRFVWNDICDWYVELAKPLLADGHAAQGETRATVAYIVAGALRLLHPFMPFITEELWQRFGASSAEPLLIRAAWPDAGEIASHAAAKAEIETLIRLIGDIRSARAELNVPAGAKLPLTVVNADAGQQTLIAAQTAQLLRLARLSAVTNAGMPPRGAMEIVSGPLTVALDLSGQIDIAGENARLDREIGKLEQERGRLAAKLANPDFVTRAPPQVVADNRARIEAIDHAMTAMHAARERLKAMAA